MTKTVEFETSAWKVWLLAILGVPFLLIGADFFFEQKLIGRFRDLVYGTEELPAIEPRDQILAALFVLVGATLILWGLKELVFPKKVFSANDQGIRLAIAGPFRPPLLVPWSRVADVSYIVLDDEGDDRPSVLLEVSDRAELPDHPWGARWVGPVELLIDTVGWSPPATDIVESLWQLRQSAGVEAETGEEEGGL
jgi:hypothetical protein